MQTAEIILHSKSPEGIELITMQMRYPKFIHAELMTHRVFSRNASSSRAIPTAKLIEEVRSDALRAAPIFWGANQKGMQAVEELDGDYLTSAQREWRRGALSAAGTAEIMSQLGVHKQIVNRILEPFSHINVIVTATEWDNFFGLRLDKGAQPEMRALAEAMWIARKKSSPQHLSPGAWHLPYVRSEDVEEICQMIVRPGGNNSESLDIARCVSVARCARVSYLSFETGKKSTIEEDLKLYERLINTKPIHASPAEHQATPDTYDGKNESLNFYDWNNSCEHGNFKGWRQYRKMLEGEACARLPNGYDRELMK